MDERLLGSEIGSIFVLTINLRTQRYSAIELNKHRTGQIEIVQVDICR